MSARPDTYPTGGIRGIVSLSLSLSLSLCVCLCVSLASSVCVRAHARARARVCVCVCARACVCPNEREEERKTRDPGAPLQALNRCLTCIRTGKDADGILKGRPTGPPQVWQPCSNPVAA
jgi:hypothetical protein